jgi:spore coat polysaccharide biosynthesis protein SpsF
MGSTRLPGKMLRVVHGKTILQYVIERLSHCPAIGEIVVATSIEPADAAIVDFCHVEGLPCVRGPSDDVAARFEQVVNTFGFECFARICGDRPMLDAALLSRAASLYDDDVDVVTNVQPRTFPAGQTVEIVRARPFAAACASMREVEDREHVTRYFYRHPKEYRIINFESGGDYDGVHLAIDTDTDLRRFDAILARMDRPHWSYGLSDLVALYREVA